MISPLMVYLVMQADSVIPLLGFSAAILLGSGVPVFVCIENEDNRARQRKTGLRMIACGVALAILTSLVPSTKTLAAMIIIPAITSDGAIELALPEASELYNLAKDAIRPHIKSDNQADSGNEK